MTPEREAHLLTQVPTLGSLEELEAFKAELKRNGEMLGSDLMRWLDVRRTLLARRERKT